jgi:glucose-6-phosphate 1-dehydrogenase
MNTPVATPTILVIVGISGDLSKRKLLPAIRQIHRAGRLPENFRIIGISRRKLTKESVLPRGDKTFLRKALNIRQMDLTDPAAYKSLYDELAELEKSYGKVTQRLFYLSVPPQASQPVIELLGQAGFGKIKSTKLLLEKPFGSDLASAKDLIDHIKKHFKEEMVYRIDHFLAKEMAQNIVYFRAGNSLLKRTWNKDFIESIEITASEEIGIEGRVGFYEQTGALRDLVQSHLLQLAALTLMHLPAWNKLDAVPYQRLRALRSLRPPQDVASQTVRGQYKGYRKEVNNADSAVETFVRLMLYSNDSRWIGVPIILTAGKELARKFTEIRIRYRQEDAAEANELVLRIQPNEGAEILLWSKQPGYERELKQLPLDFSYRHHFAGLPEAYERVFVDAMRADRTLFTTSDEVLASWRILKPVQDRWNMTDRDLKFYKPGSTPEKI